ncbi:C-X-C chemokine receptor type 5 [Echeneis naucrates]|uniref:G-protein coupled receptors family 1 profile domain-containing protein n=1 Tax=Echeneis naucrates TaxID=173247 RepID=A0A665W062_ECHNA|nr:C-X-C chemokine receptor type 5 [Echeneis naucrates]
MEGSVNYSFYIYDDYKMTINQSSTFICGDEELGLWNFNTVFLPVLYSLIFLLGMVGNSLMITVLLRRQRLLRITEIYLLHLALADLMLLFTFPFILVDKVNGWLFGNFLCKLIGLVTNFNLLCGSFLLACIGFDRYLAIVHAVPSMRCRRPKTVHLTCMLLWLVCFGLSMPTVVFLAVKEEYPNSSRLLCSDYNYEIHAHNWVLTKRVLDHIFFFFPLTIMSYCYTALIVTLCNSQKSKTKEGAIRLASLVTLVFCFCWFPYNITLVTRTMVDMRAIAFEECKSYGSLQVALEITKTLGLCHCCLNPFLYAFVGVEFRKELIRLLCEVGCGRVCLPFIRAHHYSRPSISDGVSTTSTTYI